jgi:aminocarboxymuconate-semialdehyde decarboxylase
LRGIKKVIDFHAHWFGDWLYKKSKGRGEISATLSEEDNLRIEKRIRSMDSDGVDVEVLSLVPLAATADQSSISSSKVIRTMNRLLGNIVEKHKDRFVGLALIRTDEAGATIDEIDRCVVEDKLRGVLTFRRAMNDFFCVSEEILIYERIKRWGIPVVVRDSGDAHHKVRSNFRKSKSECSVARRVFGSALGLLSLAQSSISEQFPSLPIIFGRCYRPIGRGYVSVANCESNVADKPRPSLEALAWEDKTQTSKGEYFRNLYLDTVSSEIEIEFFNTMLGPEHMVFGSDSPFRGAKPQIELLKSSNFTENEVRSVLSDNAAKILRLDDN